MGLPMKTAIKFENDEGEGVYAVCGGTVGWRQ